MTPSPPRCPRRPQLEPTAGRRPQSASRALPPHKGPTRPRSPPSTGCLLRGALPTCRRVLIHLILPRWGRQAAFQPHLQRNSGRQAGRSLVKDTSKSPLQPFPSVLKFESTLAR